MEKAKMSAAALPPAKKGYLIFKRGMDIFLSVFFLLLLSPVFLIVAIAVKAEDGGPVFFVHRRLGKNGVPIGIYKFRSMKMETDSRAALSEAQRKTFEEEFKMDHDPRVTRVGGLIRKTSLDELPQLLNILKGELSLIGPRPVLPEEAERYGENEPLFLSVKPGLTGYWQTHGRNSIPYPKRMEMELFYAQNYSFWLDLKIFIRTFYVVLSRNGAK